MDPNNKNTQESSSLPVTPQPVTPVQTPAVSQSLTNNPPTQPNPNQMQPQTATTQTQSVGVSRLRLIAYFLIGLFTSFFGLIIAGLWILIKVKENKKPRFISLISGLISALVIGILFGIFISPKIKQTLINNYPEMAYIPNEIQKDYPNAQIGISVDTNKSFSGGNTETTSTLTVSIASDQDLTASERKNIGEKVCTLLEEHNVNYTNITVSQVKIKKILFFNYDQSFTENRSCKEWKEKPPYQLPVIPK